MLQSVCDPGYVDCVFVGDLNAAAIVVWEDRVGEIVIGDNGRRCGCRESGFRCGLSQSEVEALENVEEESGGGKEVVGKGHFGELKVYVLSQVSGVHR